MNQYPPAVPSQRTNGLAITSFILGICVIFMCCFTGLPAIIFGIFGLRQIDKNPGMEGKWMAIVGIVLGGISLLFIPVMASLMIPAFHGAMEGAKQTIEINECKQVGVMLMEYAVEHDGKYPDSLQVLEQNPPQPSAVLDKMLYQEGTREYKWTLTPGLTTESPPETVLLRAKKSSGLGHKLGHVIYTLDGTAKIDRD